jgi:hypothetical protein
MFSKTKSTQIVLSSMFALIPLLLCIRPVCAQARAGGGNVAHIVVDTTTLDYDSDHIVVGQSGTKHLTVSNTSTVPLVVFFDFGLPAAPFSVAPQDAGGFRLPPNGQRAVTVTFQPTDIAAHNDTLSLDHTDPDTAAPIQISLHGQGIVIPTLTLSSRLVHGDCQRRNFFDLEIDGLTVKAHINGGSTNPRPQSIGTHTAGVTGDFDFSTGFGGDCDARGQVTLASGDNKICTIDNFDHRGFDQHFGTPRDCKCPGSFCTEPGGGDRACLQCT